MKCVAILLVIVALACGQYIPQTVSLIDLVPGVTYTGNIVSNPSNVYYSTPYRLWIPSNTSSFNLTISNTNYTACSYVAFYYRSNGAACNPNSYDDDTFWCGNAYYDYTSSSKTVTFLPGYSSNSYVVGYKPGDYFYVSASKDSSTTATCSYSITAQVEASCPANTIGITTGLSTSSSSTTGCSTYTSVPASGTTTLNVTNTIGDGYYQIWTTDVPLRTGMISVILNISDANGGYFYGTQYTPYGSSGTYKCYDSSASCSNGYCVYELDCYTPRVGLFVFSLLDDNLFNGTITFTFTTCAGMLGGYNCSFPEMMLNTSMITSGMTITVPANAGGWLSYPQAIYYWDIPANYTGPDVILYVTSPQSATLQVRINGYPEYNSYYGYEVSDEGQTVGTTTPTSWGITAFDYVFAGRYYFAFLCRDSTNACVFAVTANATTPTTSGGSSTTTTGTVSTTTTGNATSTSGSSTTMGNTTMSSTTMGMNTTMSSTTMGATTIATTRPLTTMGLTTAAQDSGIEYLIPSIALLLVALLF